MKSLNIDDFEIIISPENEVPENISEFYNKYMRRLHIMVCITDCSSCKHERPLKDGWDFCCDAFPDGGAPNDFTFGFVKQMKECNNGIGYEPKESEIDDMA